MAVGSMYLLYDYNDPVGITSLERIRFTYCELQRRNFIQVNIVWICTYTPSTRVSNFW